MISESISYYRVKYCYFYSRVHFLVCHVGTCYLTENMVNDKILDNRMQ